MTTKPDLTTAAGVETFLHDVVGREWAAHWEMNQPRPDFTAEAAELARAMRVLRAFEEYVSALPPISGFPLIESSKSHKQRETARYWKRYAAHQFADHLHAAADAEPGEGK